MLLAITGLRKNTTVPSYYNVGLKMLIIIAVTKETTDSTVKKKL
jgi:hypothetical protein